jgi:hypothetical protein
MERCGPEGSQIDFHDQDMGEIYNSLRPDSSGIEMPGSESISTAAAAAAAPNPRISESNATSGKQ